MRFAICVVGCAAFGWGIAVMIRAHAGVAPWDVLHTGLSARLGSSFGTAGFTVGALVTAVAWRLGQAPGMATVINMCVIGWSVDLWLALGVVPDAAGQPLPVRLVQTCAGIAILAAGTGFYVGAGRSAGPRDSLMLAVSRITGWRIAFARNAQELIALLVGVGLGGAVGIGTILFAVLIGPGVEASFWALNRSPLVVRPAR